MGDDQKYNMIEESERDVFKKFERTFTNTLGNAKSIENLEQATDTNFQIFSKPVAQLIVFFFEFGRRTFHQTQNKMSHSSSIELKFSIKRLVKFLRRYVQFFQSFEAF